MILKSKSGCKKSPDLGLVCPFRSFFSIPPIRRCKKTRFLHRLIYAIYNRKRYRIIYNFIRDIPVGGFPKKHTNNAVFDKFPLKKRGNNKIFP